MKVRVKTWEKVDYANGKVLVHKVENEDNGLINLNTIKEN